MPFIITMKCPTCRRAADLFSRFTKSIPDKDTNAFVDKIRVYMKGEGIKQMWHPEHEWIEHHNGERDSDWLDFKEYLKKHRMEE